MRKSISFFCILLYASLFSFSFYTEISGPHFPLPNQITEVYLLEGCGITESQALYAKNEFNPNVYVNDSKSFGSAIHVITSINDFPNLGVLIRREIAGDLVESEYAMVTRYSSQGQYLIIIEENNLYPTTANLLHEYGHIVGLGHTDISSAVMYSISNSTTSLYQDDINGIYAQYCKPSFTVPTEPLKFLRGVNRNVSIEFNPFNKTTPSEYQIDTWDDATPGDQRQHLITCENVYGSNPISYIADDWDTSELTTGLHKFKLYVWGSEDCTGNYTHNQYGHDVAMDELEVMLYDLTFDSPQENQRYSVSTPLNFKVFGKSASADVDISEIGNIATVTYKLEEDDLFDTDVFETETNEATNFELTENLVNYNIDAVDYLVTVTVKDASNNELAKIEKMPIKLYIPVDIESPLPGNQYYTLPSGGKESITDTLAIKVRVPEVFGAYPSINIKIDDVYVNQSNITFDSAEAVWIYNWDLSTVSPTEFGKRYTITSEIDGDPTSNAVTGIYLVEALFYEDFETITSLTAAGWYVESYESPPQTYTGWIIANHPVSGIDNQCAVGQSTASTSFYYWLFTPAINVPDNSNGETKLEYKMNFSMIEPPATHSYIKFYVCDVNRVRLTAPLILYPVNGQWTDFEYDLTPFAGQTIKLQWWHYYAGTTCGNTFYYIDDVLVYTTPDTSAPAIDFIAGNSADIDEDMNLNLGFNDNSGISSVTADYSIEGDSNTITLSPVKGTYNYSGTIPARDHMCEGSITFRIKDSVGNETVSSGHSISWGIGGILTAPENVVVSQPTSTTISITWDIVDGATSYKVFSSTDPYGTFTEDSTGTFTESRKWEKTIDGNKYFYYVIATNPTKFDVEAIKEEEFEIAKAKEDVSDR